MNLLLLVLLAMNYVSVNGDEDETEDVELNVHDTFPLNTESMVKKFKTNRPIIGVITMPIKGSNVLDNLNIAKDESHIGASFVKLIEGAGARVVPLIETFNNTMVKDLLRSINGVLLPGGSESIIKSNYQRISRLAFDYSIAMYKKGITWPIMGICRGFQMLMSMLHPKTFTVTPTDAYNLTLRLQLTDDAKKSRLLGRAPIGVRKVLTKEKITFNAHVNGITTQTFKKYKELKDMWRIISTNKDRNGREFISTFEGIEYPMYGLQWHPEKPLYVWNPILDIDHSVHSIMVSQYMANFFVCEARKNSNSFKSRAEAEHWLIYQFRTHYVGNIKKCAYEQIYMWKLFGHGF